MNAAKTRTLRMNGVGSREQNVGQSCSRALKARANIRRSRAHALTVDRACRKLLGDDVLRARSAVPLIGTLGLVLGLSKLRSATGKAGWGGRCDDLWAGG